MFHKNQTVLNKPEKLAVWSVKCSVMNSGPVRSDAPRRTGSGNKSGSLLSFSGAAAAVLDAAAAALTVATVIVTAE